MMLSELQNPRQIAFEGFRRWFTDADIDLVIWYRDETCVEVLGFQLSYDKQSIQHAFTWTVDAGFQHSRVDDGEQVFASKMTPVLIPANGFDGARVKALFLDAAVHLEYGLVVMVSERIDEWNRRNLARAYLENRAGDTVHPDGRPDYQHPGLLGQILLDNLRDAFLGPGWHGAELMPTLSALSVEQAKQLPAGSGDDRLSAWQIALHCAYWKHTVTRHFHEFLGIPDSRKLHDISLEDWCVIPEDAGPDDWKRCLEVLQLEHEALVRAVTLMVVQHPESLMNIEAKSGLPWAKFIYGAAAHDVYHTAQIRNMHIESVAE